MSARRGPPPALLVARELAIAAADVALLPLRLGAFWFERDALAAEVRALVVPDDADGPPDPAPREDPPAAHWPDRPLRVLVSWAEPSGELHATNLVRELRARAAAAGAPPPAIAAVGGARAADEGLELVARPADRAAMGVSAVVRALPFYVDVLSRAARHLRDARPDVFVPVDSPGLHVPLGRIARSYRVPVCHFVTPQYWGWAPWRVHRYRRSVDRALSILPFEPAWFARRGVPVEHVGHPILDELEGVPTRPRPREDVPERLVVLPGSRRSVVRRNLPWMLAVARDLQASRPALEVVLSHRAELSELVAEVVGRAGRTGAVRLAPDALHVELARAGAALSVSGTVLLDLLHHRVPTVVVYRLGGRVRAALAPHALLTPWFASPNLLAGAEVLPEHCFAGDGPRRAVLDALARCYNDPEWRRRCVGGLERAAARLGPPGAVRRAAEAAVRTALEGQETP